MTDIYSRTLSSFALPAGKGNSARTVNFPDELKDINHNATARSYLLGYLVGVGPRDEQGVSESTNQLAKMFKCIETFFHPSNTGKSNH